MAFSDLATEVTWCHCMYFIDVLVKAGANLPVFKGQGHRTHLSMRGVAKNLGLSFLILSCFIPT